MKIKNVVVASSLMLAVGSAQAFWIVDSGAGRQNGGAVLDNSRQWLAQEFTLDQAYRVTNIEGWMGASVPGTVTLALYTDTAFRPGSELYSAEFSVEGRLNDWYGASDLSWDLSAGSYWAAFEVRDGQSMWGYMGGEPPHIVGANAWSYNHGASWIDGGSNSLGLRVGGILAPIPEPSTYAMMLAGLGLLGLTAKRRRQKLNA